MKLLLVILLFISSSSWAQVKHNFKMDPSKTDCHELPENMNALSVDSIITIIQSANYRFKQNISISRYHSPQALAYYSCDGKTGYVVAQESDTTQQIFMNFPKTAWDELMETNDPIGFYNSPIFEKHRFRPEN